MQSQRKTAGRLGVIRPRPAPQGSRERTRTVLEGRVVEVLKDDTVVFVTAGGRRVVCRCPMHVDPGWVRAALAAGAVAAEASVPEGDGLGTVWCLLPTAEQRKRLAETIALAAAASVEIACGKAKLQLRKDGTVRLRGRDVFARGSRVTRILGGAVRLN